MTKDTFIKQIVLNRNSPHLEGIVGMLLDEYSSAGNDAKPYIGGSLPLTQMTEQQLKQRFIDYKAGRITLSEAITDVETYSSASNIIKY